RTLSTGVPSRFSAKRSTASASTGISPVCLFVFMLPTVTCISRSCKGGRLQVLRCGARGGTFPSCRIAHPSRPVHLPMSHSIHLEPAELTRSVTQRAGNAEQEGFWSGEGSAADDASRHLTRYLGLML